MPDLLSILRPSFAEFIQSYINSKSKVEEFVETSRWSPVARLFVGHWLSQEIALSEEKHSRASNFFKSYLKNPIMNPHPFMTLSRLFSSVERRSSNLSAISNASRLGDLPGVRLAGTPSQGNYVTQASKDRDLDYFSRGLHIELNKIAELRKKHKPGKYEALLQGMSASTNIMIRFYNKIAIKMWRDLDPDNVNMGGDPYLQWIQFTAEILCKIAYDRQLVIYSQEHQIHLNPIFYMGTGVESMDTVVRDTIFQLIYNSLHLLVEKHTQLFIFKLIQENSDYILTQMERDILGIRYTELPGLMSPNDADIEIRNIFLEINIILNLIKENLGKIPFNTTISENISRLNALEINCPTLNYNRTLRIAPLEKLQNEIDMQTLQNKVEMQISDMNIADPLSNNLVDAMNNSMHDSDDSEEMVGPEIFSHYSSEFEVNECSPQIASVDYNTSPKRSVTAPLPPILNRCLSVSPKLQFFTPPTINYEKKINAVASTSSNRYE